jgi:hypothetical protein
MREKDNWKGRPGSDRRIAAGGNGECAILRGHFVRARRICDYCVERDNILHCDARDTGMESLGICLCGGCACDQ